MLCDCGLCIDLSMDLFVLWVVNCLLNVFAICFAVFLLNVMCCLSVSFIYWRDHALPVCCVCHLNVSLCVPRSPPPPTPIYFVCVCICQSYLNV